MNRLLVLVVLVPIAIFTTPDTTLEDDKKVLEINITKL